MFKSIALIVRFNQIVLSLKLLGVNKLNDSERANIWYIISSFANTNEDIIQGVLNGRSKIQKEKS